ncbi:MAG: flagellar motor protein MotB [Clostridiales bacterium]|jgi:chemotaxis protein MotB|nr:flagellar motor protein MotB [Clostridiales bacterium]
MARKPKKAEGSSGAPEWMATYSDLVTLLLCFFVLLYASANLDEGKLQAISQSFGAAANVLPSISNNSSQGINQLLGSGSTQMPVMCDTDEASTEMFREGQEELERMAADFKTYFAEEQLTDQVEVKIEGTYVILNFQDGLLFDKGRADLKESSIAALQGIVAELGNNTGAEILIEGHTDSDPISTVMFPNNIYLSNARATAVMMYLIDNGIKPQRIGAVGYGEYRPVAPNDDEGNKSKNRRV